MPWRGPEVPGQFPTLGYQVGDWIEAHCVVPDGDHMGEKYTLTDEMWRFLLWYYRLTLEGGFAYVRGGQLVRPQKWGKGPFASAIICAEAEGPTVPDGWDADGEPVGRPWATPWIQVTAVSEDQTDNVWRALQPMIELGDLSADIPDTGLGRINLQGGGIIQPVTSSAGSRLGQRVTFVLEDETHAWTQGNKGRMLADTQRRNVAGTKGRWLETTNAWDPNEDSVAQNTSEESGPDVFLDHTQPPASLKATNARDRRKIIKIAYGDSWWVDQDRIESEWLALADRDPAQAERFFGNRITSSSDDWIDVRVVEERAAEKVVAHGEMVTLGFDGSLGTDQQNRVADSTVLRGCRVSDGHLFTVGLWESPGPGVWEPPRAEVTEAVREAFGRYQVLLLYADPPWWQSELGSWAAEHGEDKVLEWWTNRDVQMAAALERLHTDLTNGTVTHDGDKRVVTHYRNARRLVKRAAHSDPDGRRERVLVRKPHQNSPEKIDSVPADALALEARVDAITRGLDKPPKNRTGTLRTYRARGR